MIQHSCSALVQWPRLLTSECSPRYDKLVRENRRDSRHVTSPASWVHVYVMPRIKNSKKKVAGVLNAIRAREEKRLCSISWFFYVKAQETRELIKNRDFNIYICITRSPVSPYQNYHISSIHEHSAVSQAWSLHACWTRMLYHDSLQTIDNSQSTKSAKTLKIFNVYSSLGL